MHVYLQQSDPLLSCLPNKGNLLLEGSTLGGFPVKFLVLVVSSSFTYLHSWWDRDTLLPLSLSCHLVSIHQCALILFIQTLALYKSFTYLLTQLVSSLCVWICQSLLERELFSSPVHFFALSIYDRWDEIFIAISSYHAWVCVCTCVLVLISATRLGLDNFLSLTLSVCLFVTLLLQIASSFLFLENRTIFWPSSVHVALYKMLFFDFWIRPLTPRIYSPKLLAIALHYHIATRGCALGTAALPGESRQSTELRGWPLLPWQRNLA